MLTNRVVEPWKTDEVNRDRMSGDPDVEPSSLSIAGLLARLAARVGRLVRTLTRRDHGSLYGGWYTSFNPNISGRKYFYLALGCAPSRRFRRPRSVQPEVVLAFLNDVIPDGFSLPAFHSSRESVAFHTADQEGTDSRHDPLRAARIWSNGRVEFLLRVQSTTPDDDVLVVDLLSATRPIDVVAAHVRDGWFKRLYGLHTRWRRLDWYVSLSVSVADSRHGHRYWDDLAFPGRRPSARATNGYPAAPLGGLAWRQLQTRKQRSDPVDVIRPALEELISESGWHGGNDVAVDDTLEAVVKKRGAVLSFTALSAPFK